MKEPIALILIRSGSKIALVKNRFGWELAGGKIKITEDESPLAAAIRELKEETGIQCTALKEIHTGDHSAGDRMVHYFDLELAETRNLQPQNPEEIIGYKWIEAQDYSKYAHYELLAPVQKLLDRLAAQKAFATNLNQGDFGIG